MMTRMRIHPLSHLAAAFQLVASVQARTWTRAEGAKTFEGEFQSYDARKGKVTVVLLN